VNLKKASIKKQFLGKFQHNSIKKRKSKCFLPNQRKKENVDQKIAIICSFSKY